MEMLLNTLMGIIEGFLLRILHLIVPQKPSEIPFLGILSEVPSGNS